VPGVASVVEDLVTGPPVNAVLQQCLLASVFGVAAYLARRARGVLVLAMVIHGLWDMSTFYAGEHAIDTPAVLISAFGLGTRGEVLALVALVIFWRRKEVVTDAA
jgi:hypothetical protein